jgi:hypothetical protein
MDKFDPQGTVASGCFAESKITAISSLIAEHRSSFPYAWASKCRMGLECSQARSRKHSTYLANGSRRREGHSAPTADAAAPHGDGFV